MKMHIPYFGFTLIELLITVSILAIIAAVAIPSYNAYVLKSHRADGINTILSLSLAEERYRSSNPQYGTLSQVGGASTSPQGYYSMSVSNISATSYTISATAQGSQANDTENGAACTPLQLTVSSGTITKSPAGCWPS